MMPLIVILCGLFFFALFGLVIAHYILVDTARHDETSWYEILGYGVIIVLALLFFEAFEVPLLSDPLSIDLNIVGGLVPIMVSAFLLLRLGIPARMAFVTILGTAFVMVPAVTVEGGSIMAYFPFWLIPAMVSVLFALHFLPSLGEERSLGLAYVGGTMGSLIGGDLLNLPIVIDSGVRRIELGGAGILDFVFLTGIVAVVVMWSYIRITDAYDRHVGTNKERESSI